MAERCKTYLGAAQEGDLMIAKQVAYIAYEFGKQ